MVTCIGLNAIIGELCWMSRAVSGAYLADLSLIVKGLHEYAGRRPRGHPMSAATEVADRACGWTVRARDGRTYHLPLWYAACALLT